VATPRTSPSARKANSLAITLGCTPRPADRPLVRLVTERSCESGRGQLTAPPADGGRPSLSARFRMHPSPSKVDAEWLIDGPSRRPHGPAALLRSPTCGW
jgi:hypothetical protein